MLLLHKQQARMPFFCEYTLLAVACCRVLRFVSSARAVPAADCRLYTVVYTSVARSFVIVVMISVVEHHVAGGARACRVVPSSYVVPSSHF
jgi:hypothetical protein